LKHCRVINDPAEDVFLNLGMKDGSTDHCDQILVKIKLPNTALKDITLDVLEKRIICSAPKYKLNLALPHPVLSISVISCLPCRRFLYPTPSTLRMISRLRGIDEQGVLRNSVTRRCVAQCIRAQQSF